jgi:DUF1707 SHOCT-like domain
MAGSGDAAAAGGKFRASHEQRDLAIETLKDAFAYGRLTRDELETRVGQALSVQTSAELGQLTADIPGNQVAVKPVRPVRPARPRPLLKAAAGSAACFASAFALVLFAANVLDPAGDGDPYRPWSSLCLLLAFALVGVGLSIAVIGLAVSIEQRVSRKQAPPQPGTHGSAAPLPGAGASSVVMRAPLSGSGQVSRATCSMSRVVSSGVRASLLISSTTSR